MDDLDRIWASAYLMAAMKETIHGIRYDKTGHEINAQAVFNSYLKEPFDENAKSAREAIEKDLIASTAEWWPTLPGNVRRPNCGHCITARR